MDLVVEKICRLINSGKDNLFLILNCSQGTKYETLIKELIETFSFKIFRYLPQNPSGNLMAHILSKNLFVGVIEIIKESDSEDSISMNLHQLFQYHSNGLKTLIVI